MAAVFPACTELDPGTDRLSQAIDRSQVDAMPLVNARWACLDAPPPGMADPLASEVELSLTVIDTVTQVPPDGLFAHACARLDVMCETPLTPDVSPAIDGAMHLSVRQGFDGFVELRSPSSVSTMYFINRPLMRDTSEAFSIVSTRVLGGLAMQGNVALDPALGHVLIRVFDCDGNPASDIEMSNDRGGLAFSFVGGLPNVGVAVTSPDGVGGFVNVPIGYAVLQGRRVEDGRAVGTASVTVRPGWFSYGDVEYLPP